MNKTNVEAWKKRIQDYHDFCCWSMFCGFPKPTVSEYLANVNKK